MKGQSNHITYEQGMDWGDKRKNYDSRVKDDTFLEHLLS